NPSYTEQALEFIELANMAYLQYKTGSNAQKRDILDSIVSNCFGTGKYPAFRLRSPFSDYLNWRNSIDCDLRRDEPRTFSEKLFTMFVDATERHAANDNSRNARDERAAA
ncbi:MAG TPA: hypothetical protein VJQ48_08005, partial [Candidatus Binatia bacterium]|nr:hypothetical protein [Candidatus Binatia bacterium]